jgi:hypothetical protein
MSDVQVFVLIATIILCTVWIVFAIARAAKAICEHVVRSGNLIVANLQRENQRGVM